MRIKPFLQIIYGLAGLGISLFTAIMTYVIIDEPIGFKMTSQISIVVLSTLPIVAMFSYFIGVYLSKKFEYISHRLDDIDANKFIKHKHKDKIEDITSIHDAIDHLSLRLEESIAELQKNNKDLHTMIRSFSHDIKTPLTIIDGYLEEFEDGLIEDGEIPKVITILKKETAYINELSSEVIGFIRSKESMTEKKVTIHLKEYLHLEVCPLIRVSKSVGLRCEIKESDTLIFDPTALKKILINLLHNASKYTDEGTVTISMKDEKVIVQDTGIGIDPESSKKIFEPFVCLDESKNRKKSGFGLGLSIASNLAQSNGYTLAYDDSYSTGCRFVLERLDNNIA